MRRFVHEYRLNGKRVIKYDGRSKHLVSRYSYEQKELPEKQRTIFDIDGSIHTAKKDLGGECIVCLKPILKNQVYCLRNEIVFASTFRSHLYCLVHDWHEGGHYVKSIKKQGIYVIHEVIHLSKDNINDFLETLKPKVVLTN